MNDVGSRWKIRMENNWHYVMEGLEGRKLRQMTHPPGTQEPNIKLFL